MLFWIFATIIALAATAVILRPLVGREGSDNTDTTSDKSVYLDQLAQIEAEINRGTLHPNEAQTTRAEIARRLLDLEKRTAEEPNPAPMRTSTGLMAALVITLLLGSTYIYTQIGAPGAKDQPLAERDVEKRRLTQAEAEVFAEENFGMTTPELEGREAELLAQLKAELEKRPDDLTGYTILAQTLNSVGDFKGAAKAQARVIELKGTDAESDDFAIMAEAMVFATQGYVSPEAEAALAKAIQLNPGNPRAQYYSGIALAQVGKSQIAMQVWTKLLENGPEDAPWIAPVREQIQMLARETGLPLPEIMLRGPTQSDIEAAEEMTEEDRTAMIRSMVDGLADRLATEGGNVTEWARLIRSLGMLGELEQAATVYNEASISFGENENALELLNTAARDAGVIE